MFWLPLIAAAVKVAGALTAGNSADKIGTANANTLNEQADAVVRAGGAREARMRDRNQETLATQRAALLQNGVDPTSGSALVGHEQQAKDAELDALMSRYSTLLEARGLRTQADQALWQGKVAKQQSRLSAVGQLLGSAASYTSGSFGG